MTEAAHPRRPKRKKTLKQSSFGARPTHFGKKHEASDEPKRPSRVIRTFNPPGNKFSRPPPNDRIDSHTLTVRFQYTLTTSSIATPWLFINYLNRPRYDCVTRVFRFASSAACLHVAEETKHTSDHLLGTLDIAHQATTPCNVEYPT